MTDIKDARTYTIDVKIPPMPKSRLAELIDKALKSGLTFRKIRLRSGNQVPLSSLNKWHKSTDVAHNLTTDTVLALARGLGESPTVVFEAAIGKSAGVAVIKDETLAQILEDYGRLSNKERQDPRLQVTIEMLKTEIHRRLDRDA